eukprot:7502311-Alexandrium_andersonii.AAC.1
MRRDFARLRDAINRHGLRFETPATGLAVPPAPTLHREAPRPVNQPRAPPAPAMDCAFRRVEVCRWCGTVEPWAFTSLHSCWNRSRRQCSYEG